jgi:hypothetical protein
MPGSLGVARPAWRTVPPINFHGRLPPYTADVADLVTLRCKCRNGTRLDVLTVLSSGRLARGLYGGTLRRLRRNRGQTPSAPYIDALHAARAPSGGRAPDFPGNVYQYRCGKCRADWQWTHETLMAAVEQARRAGRREIVAGTDL